MELANDIENESANPASAASIPVMLTISTAIAKLNAAPSMDRRKPSPVVHVRSTRVGKILNEQRRLTAIKKHQTHGRNCIVVKFVVHLRDVNFGFIKCSNGGNTRKRRAKLTHHQFDRSDCILNFRPTCSKTGDFVTDSNLFTSRAPLR